MKNIRYCGLFLLIGAMAAVGCNGERDVKVSGSISSASDPLTSNVQLEFLEIDGESKNSIQKVSVEKLGTFEQTVPVVGDKLIVRALVDTNKDGLCTPGEQWAEQEVEIKEDNTVDALNLKLTTESCFTN
jgi:hypothetical protein